MYICLCKGITRDDFSEIVARHQACPQAVKMRHEAGRVLLRSMREEIGINDSSRFGQSAERLK